MQKAKITNSTLSIIKISGEEKFIHNLLDEKNLIGKNYLSNSTKITEDNQTILTMVIQDGDKFSADFLKTKLQGYIKDRGNLYPNCAILYSYAVYPDDAIDEIGLMEKIEKEFQRLKCE